MKKYEAVIQKSNVITRCCIEKELVGEIWTAKTNVKNGNNSWNVPSLSVL